MRHACVPLAVGAVVIAAACTSDDDGGSAADQEAVSEESSVAIEVVSARPEYVTGGDALVAVSLHDDAIDAGDVEVSAGGDDVTSAFAPDPDDDRRLVGLVDVAHEGETVIVARADDNRAEVTVTDNPVEGPLFSGEHLPLAACTTQVFGLDPSTPEDDCFAPTKVTWRYVDTAGQIKDLADPSAPPADAEMVDVDGTPVPFVLRDETGVLNRAVYRITLFEPHPDTGDPLETIDVSAWNDRLVYRFGGGCGASFTQGFSWAGDPALEVLRRGYATATATFNTFQVLCNDVISAETVEMVKERFIEGYGEPEHTIGEGGSGGAIQQILLAQNYPGLLDAIAPSLPFPDALSIGPGVFDCALLTNYYGSPSGGQLTPEQQVAINGHAVPGTCALWDASFAQTIDPSAGCRFNVAEAFGAGAAPIPGIPDAEIYDPETNPDGFRCTVWETNVAITGRDPDTGHARSGYDNEGIQYGLEALNAGTITVDQFLDLNEHIGGFDQDGQPQTARSLVPDELVARAYESGRVTGPWGGLPDTPMILTNLYTDGLGDIHDRVRSFSLLDRLSDDDQHWPATTSLWTIGVAEGASLFQTLGGAIGERAANPTFALDEWLTAAKEAQAEDGGSWQEALAATKPEAAQSRCLINGQDPIVGPEANDDPACVAAYPIHEEPRMAAGGPRSGDILKCQLVKVDDAADLYEVELSDPQIDRLADIFPDGVCDYSKPSVGQAEPDGTWQSFKD
ncbi:MAG TPA: DUF6351 family protein [Acidimicrobiales bacterium]|jgi:hypothetical protein